MNNKEKIDLIISKVPEDQKSAFVSEIREAGSKQERAKIFKKFGITLTEEEQAMIRESSHEVSDEELDEAAAGCCNACRCNSCSCN